MLDKKTVSQCISADYCRGWNDAVEAMPRWIPVEERLPNSYCGVLCTDGERVFRAAYLTGSAYIPDHWAEIMDDRTGHFVTTQKNERPAFPLDAPARTAEWGTAYWRV